jgi:hypothetical protein
VALFIMFFVHCSSAGIIPAHARVIFLGVLVFLHTKMDTVHPVMSVFDARGTVQMSGRLCGEGTFDCCAVLAHC